MIDLYYWPTPNGRKIRIFLEETGLPYRIVPINLAAGEQHSPSFVAISPNNKLPAIVDHEGPEGTEVALFESGAILMYLAQKAGRFLSNESPARYTTIEWLSFQVGRLGPTMGQVLWFRGEASKGSAEVLRVHEIETRRLFETMDKHLAGRRFFAGDYSIADMAIFPWMVEPLCPQPMLEGLRDVKRWRRRVYRRHAVRRGMDLSRRQQLRLCLNLVGVTW